MQKSKVIVVIGSIAAVIAILVIFALSQPTELVNPILVSTDKSYYQAGKPTTILVTIEVKQQIYREGEILRVEIVNENGTVYTFREITDVRPDRNMTESISLGGETAVAGEYWVIASYRGFDSQTSFEYEGFKSSTQLTGVECQPLALCTYQLIMGNMTYPINFRFDGTIENMVADPTQSLTIELKAEVSTSLQIAVPREVVDSRAGQDATSGPDDEFAVFVDEIPVDVDEIPVEAREWTKVLGISDNPDRYRILIIPIPEGSGRVDIVGTWLI